MLNYMWAAMVAIGIVWGILTGNTGAVSEGFVESGKDAVSLCITMLGVTGMWCGLAEIAERSGITQRLTSAITPVVGGLFKSIPKDHPAMAFMCLNMAANMLGLGWAATPAGLEAMKELEKLREQQGKQPAGVATDEMCTFVVLNISSLQLIPVNMIAYRSSFGSTASTAIAGPAMLATMASTAAAVLFCRLMSGSGQGATERIGQRLATKHGQLRGGLREPEEMEDKYNGESK